MRYLPQTSKTRDEMLRVAGAKSIEDLYKNIPQKARRKQDFNLPDHMGELEVERHLSSYANQNHAAPDGPFFLGAGCYYHHIPASVDYIIQRSEFLTAYTPYQPEIAQGTLQVIFEFQTFIAQLTGKDVANASLYDGATAAVEAALMAMRVTKRNKVVIATSLHPDYEDTLKTYIPHAENHDYSATENINDAACIIIQSPDFLGSPQGLTRWRDYCDRTGALLIVVVTEILSLGLLPAPVEADIVCGEAQSIGLPMSYGGPHLGFFACNNKYLRQMPGRLCGMTKDANGDRSFVLTLNTREQHIRRDKATSNICTNQGLCALAFTVHMSLLGENGFRTLARLNHEKACRLADALTAIDGVELVTNTFFNEFTISLPKNAEEIVHHLSTQGIIAGYPLGRLGHPNNLLVAATEMTSETDINLFANALKESL